MAASSHGPNFSASSISGQRRNALTYLDARATFHKRGEYTVKGTPRRPNDRMNASAGGESASKTATPGLRRASGCASCACHMLFTLRFGNVVRERKRHESCQIFTGV